MGGDTEAASLAWSETSFVDIGTALFRQGLEVTNVEPTSKAEGETAAPHVVVDDEVVVPETRDLNVDEIHVRYGVLRRAAVAALVIAIALCLSRDCSWRQKMRTLETSLVQSKSLAEEQWRERYTALVVNKNAEIDSVNADLQSCLIKQEQEQEQQRQQPTCVAASACGGGSGSGYRVGAHVTAATSRDGVTRGQVGIVKSQSEDGVFAVSFLDNPAWSARQKDLRADPSKDRIRPGQRVRVSSAVETPQYKWGGASAKHAGVVASVSELGKVFVDFGLSQLWLSTLQELEVVTDGSGHLPGEIQIGSHVSWRKKVEFPSYAAMENLTSNVGVVKRQELRWFSVVYIVDFPGQKATVCALDEIEIDAQADMVRPGALVVVREDIKRPLFDWNGISHEDVGTVTEITANGIVSVDFPGRKESWRSGLRDLQAL